MTRIHRPSPATLIAFVALFVALGGPSQAAQLAKKVTGHHKSLRGPRGPRGPAGFAKTPIVRTAVATTPIGGGAVSGTVLCKPSEVAVGGGVGNGSDPIVETIPYKTPAASGVLGWTGAVKSLGGSSTSALVFVLCVPRS